MTDYRFVLKRWWPPKVPRYKQKDLYEEILNGTKTIEYRDASDHWTTMLFKGNYDPRFLTHSALGVQLPNQFRIPRTHHKHRKAIFVVGYTSYPRLIADVVSIYFDKKADQYQIWINNVREEKNEMVQIKLGVEQDGV